MTQDDPIAAPQDPQLPMEIHAPLQPVHSLKDFGIHIAIVTIGILIALSLEGIREAVHNHNLVRETRENFRTELQHDLNEDQREFQAVNEANQNLQKLVADLPELERSHPEQIAQRLAAVKNPFYFFTQNSWQVALSTGAPAHMSTQEVKRYADVFESVRLYTGYQAQVLSASDHASAFFDSRPTLTQADFAEGAERIRLLARMESSLQYVGAEFHDGLDKTLKEGAE